MRGRRERTRHATNDSQSEGPTPKREAANEVIRQHSKHKESVLTGD